jgi:hypothetical protein
VRTQADVAAPEGVDLVGLGGEAALQEVAGPALRRGVGDRGPLRAPPGTSGEAALRHEAGDALAADAQAGGAQRPRDARRAVGAT